MSEKNRFSETTTRSEVAEYIANMEKWDFLGLCAGLSFLAGLTTFVSVDFVFTGCRRAFCWNSMWRNLQRHEVIESSGEVNWLIDGPCGERLPAIDLAHVDLTGGEQRPEQHGRSLC